MTVKFTDEQQQIWRSPPKHGQDTLDILEENGFATEQINFPKENGVTV